MECLGSRWEHRGHVVGMSRARDGKAGCERGKLTGYARQHEPERVRNFATRDKQDLTEYRRFRLVVGWGL